MTRIAFIHNRFPAGGAERITIDIASYLSGFGKYEVFVYASRIAEHPQRHQSKEYPHTDCAIQEGEGD